jgi:hypothetical protein
MANLVIRPASGTGNKVVVQDQAGGAVLTTADSGATMASNVTGIPAAGVTGVLPAAVTGGSGLTALGTVASGTLGSGVTFPSGCVIGGAMLERFQVTSYVQTTSTSFVDTGIWGSYTPIKSSSVTRLKIHFHVGFSQAQNYLTYHTCGMDSINSTTYASATSLDDSAYNHRNIATADRTYHSTWDFIQTTSGRVSAIFPSSITSYSAGTPYYFRLYYKTAGGIFYFGHIHTQLAFWIEEIML